MCVLALLVNSMLEQTSWGLKLNYLSGIGSSVKGRFFQALLPGWQRKESLAKAVVKK